MNAGSGFGCRIENDSVVHIPLEEVVCVSDTLLPSRVNKDDIVKSQQLYTVTLNIVNGGLSDGSGDLSYMGSNGFSTPDHMFASPTLFEHIENFKIESR